MKKIKHLLIPTLILLSLFSCFLFVGCKNSCAGVYKFYQCINTPDNGNTETITVGDAKTYMFSDQIAYYTENLMVVEIYEDGNGILQFSGKQTTFTWSETKDDKIIAIQNPTLLGETPILTFEKSKNTLTFKVYNTTYILKKQ